MRTCSVLTYYMPTGISIGECMFSPIDRLLDCRLQNDWILIVAKIAPSLFSVLSRPVRRSMIEWRRQCGLAASWILSAELALSVRSPFSLLRFSLFALRVQNSPSLFAFAFAFALVRLAGRVSIRQSSHKLKFAPSTFVRS